MKLPFHLGLRDGRHLVSLLKVEGRSNEVLGVAYPEDADRRARIPTNWGREEHSPRHAAPATVNIPLDVRAQTILSYEVGHEARAEINGGTTPLTQSRRDEQTGVKRRIHRGGVSLHVDARPGARAEDPNRSFSATPSARARHGGRGPRG